MSAGPDSHGQGVHDCQGPAEPGDQPGVNHILSHAGVVMLLCQSSNFSHFGSVKSGSSKAGMLGPRFTTWTATRGAHGLVSRRIRSTVVRACRYRRPVQLRRRSTAGETLRAVWEALSSTDHLSSQL